MISLHPLRFWLSIGAVVLALQISPSAMADDPIMDFLVRRGIVEAPLLSSEQRLASKEVDGQPVTSGAVDARHAPPAPVTADDLHKLRAAVLVYAMAYIGVPYQRGGAGFERGVDCSGFVQVAYREGAGILLPRKAEQQAQVTLPITPDALLPGDLVFFNTTGAPFSHVGIFIGDGRFIHSPRTGARVRIERLDKPYWQKRFDGARRVVRIDASASAF